MSDNVVTTVSTPDSERAAAPAARRIVSAGHWSRSRPNPTASTLSTGRDGTTIRVSCSAPPLAPSASRATSISPTASASRYEFATTVAGPSSSPLRIGTIRTDEATLRLGSVLATATVGDG